MPLFAPALTVEEEDGSPTTAGVKKLQFPNGSVTNDGGGTVSVAAASGSVKTASSSETASGTIFPFRRIFFVAVRR